MKLEQHITLDFCDTDLVAEPNNVDIWEHEGNTYFTWEAAMRESEKQGLRLPTKEELGQALSIFEGEYDKLRETLGIKLAGYRSWSVGQYYLQGTYGYYWSSTPYTTYSYYAYFFSGDEAIATNYNRGNGFSVRCIRK